MQTKEFWDQIHLFKTLHDKALDPVCEKYGLTRTELEILLFLSGNPDVDTATEIVEKRGLSKSGVSVSVRHLVEYRCLESYYMDGNRRTVHLRICPRAQAAIDDGRQSQEAFFRALLDGFSREEIDEVKRAFDRVVSNLNGMAGGDGWES